MIERRSFLKAALASLTLNGCANPAPLLVKLPEPTDVQRKTRRVAPSVVSILRAESYAEDLFSILKNNIEHLNIADFKNKSLNLEA